MSKFIPNRYKRDQKLESRCSPYKRNSLYARQSDITAKLIRENPSNVTNFGSYTTLPYRYMIIEYTKLNMQEASVEEWVNSKNFRDG